MNKIRLTDGIYTASLTPFKEDLSVDYALLTEHCKWLIDQGSTGIAIMGTTGEANSLSCPERKKLIESVINGGISASKLMVGTGCCSIDETVSLTKHALSSGAGGVLMLPPFYYKQVTDDGLMEYFNRVIDRVNDDRLQIYLYHFPQMSGMHLSVELIHRLAEKYPHQIVGLKDSSGDFEHMKGVMNVLPDFKLYPGSERFLVDGLRIGSAGCVSATANVTIRLIANVLSQWGTTNVDQLQTDLTNVRTTFEGKPFTAILKQYLAIRTGYTGWLNIRPPNSLIDNEIVENLIAQHEELDFQPTMYEYAL